MPIQVGEASPPHRESAVAEWHVREGEVVNVPAEVYRDGEQLMIALFAREGGVSWEFRLADFLEAVGRSVAVLGS